MMFGPKMGTWYIYSKKDPRWDKEGRGEGLISCGGPPQIQKWVDKCTKKYGPPPDDLTQEFWKD